MKSFKIGSLVVNFGAIAEVLEIREDGFLVVREVSTLTHHSCGKWVANPALCEPYGEPACRHKDGFVVFG
jgi:hypothetical protein